MHRRAWARVPLGSKPLIPPFIYAFLGMGVVLAIGGGILAWSYNEVLSGGLSGLHEYSPIEGVIDVHALVFDTEDPQELYIATHHGLVHIVNDTGLARLGPNQRDFLALAVHPTDENVMWIGGRDESGITSFGVRKSMDGGFTWKTLGLKGSTVLVLAVSPADPDRLWAHERGRMLSSTDAGVSWDIVNRTANVVYALAPHPTDANTFYAATLEGFGVSRDAGASITIIREGASHAVAIDPQDPDHLLVESEGGIMRTKDAGATWTVVNFTAATDVGSLVIHPTDPAIAYAGTYGGAVYKTEDGGESWRVIVAPLP